MDRPDGQPLALEKLEMGMRQKAALGRICSGVEHRISQAEGLLLPNPAVSTTIVDEGMVRRHGSAAFRPPMLSKLRAQKENIAPPPGKNTPDHLLPKRAASQRPSSSSDVGPGPVVA